MPQSSLQLDPETRRMIAQLAEWWELSTTRNNTAVIRRCIERVFQQEAARLEADNFDRLQRSEPDPLR